MDDVVRYVAYCQVPASGDVRQRGALARQKAAIANFLDRADRALVGEFTDVAQPDAPDNALAGLGLALDCCRALTATLIAAPAEGVLDPDAMQTAREAGVEVVVIDPEASAPEQRPGHGSDDAAGDAPYLPLGRRRMPPKRPHAARPRPVGNRRKADAFARAILPVIEQIRAAGAISLSDIADELNARNVPTARGRRWHPATVRNILIRAQDEAEDS